MNSLQWRKPQKHAELNTWKDAHEDAYACHATLAKIGPAGPILAPWLTLQQYGYGYS